MNRLVKILISVTLVVLGGMVYLLYRDRSLLMFSWFDAVGIGGVVDSMRAWAVSVDPYHWVRYNMPAGLWLFSYMFVIDAVWGDDDSGSGRLFVYALPALALVSEFLQIAGLCPGVFDVLDVLGYLLAIVSFKIIKHYER